jgi:hypothetical protein
MKGAFLHRQGLSLEMHIPIKHSHNRLTILAQAGKVLLSPQSSLETIRQLKCLIFWIQSSQTPFYKDSVSKIYQITAFLSNFGTHRPAAFKYYFVFRGGGEGDKGYNNKALTLQEVFKLLISKTSIFNNSLEGIWIKSFMIRDCYTMRSVRHADVFTFGLNPTLLNTLTALSAETSVKSILSGNLYLIDRGAFCLFRYHA